MSPVKSEQAFAPNLLVEQVARLIRTFNHQQITQLIELVPELRTVQLQKTAEVTEQSELIAYFDRQLETLQEYPPLQDEAPFLAGLTVAEFFALPEAEQNRIWAEAHLEAERNLGNREQHVRPDALPAR